MNTTGTQTDSIEAQGWRARSRQVLERNHGTARGWVRALFGELEYLTGRLKQHTRLRACGYERLVFVCLGNVNRSAFAEQVARGLGVHCCSIGLSTTTGAPAFQRAIEIAPMFGLDLTSHRATDIKDYAFQPDDLLLVMEVRHARRLLALGVPAENIALLGHWAAPHRIHLHDPHTLSAAYFRTCFALIQSGVQGLVAELQIQNSPCLLA